MKAILAAAALLLVAGAAFLVLRPAAPPPPPPAGVDMSEHIAMDAAPPGEAPTAPPKPKGDPAKQPRLPAPDSVLRRPPGPLPPGGAGEILRADLPKEEAEKVEAMKLRLMEADLGEVDWKQQGLRRVLDVFAEKTGVPFEIDGEGLEDEPITHRGPGVNALEILRTVTMGRNLRFEVGAGKVVVRR